MNFNNIYLHNLDILEFTFHFSPFSCLENFGREYLAKINKRRLPNKTVDPGKNFKN